MPMLNFLQHLPNVSASTAILGSLLVFSGSALHAQEASAGRASIAPLRESQHPGLAHTVTLDPVEPAASQTILRNDSKPGPVLPANFRKFSSASVNQGSEVQTLSLRFHSGATLNSLTGTKDFRVVQGGSCSEGHFYLPNATCTVMVQFTPQGPGHRLGKLKVTNSADAEPMNVGLVGEGSAPVVSFTPSIVNTVAGTYPGSVGLISGGTNLAVDGGDTLYIADTGNKVVRFMEPGGAVQTLKTGVTLTDPQGITADEFGSVYFSQDNPATLTQVSTDGFVIQYGGGSASCNVGTTCALSTASFAYPGALATDFYGNVFLVDYAGVDALVRTTDEIASEYIPAEDDYNENGGDSIPLAIDANDYIYAFLSDTGCFITRNSLYEAEQNSNVQLQTVAGSRTCGFSGDGGQARGANLGGTIGQMTFDLAGNLYFADTLNQRVRRVDAATGLIQTIAGNGTAGFTGDAGPATTASLANPTGVAVDSNGQVYILSSTTATGTAQVVRVVTTTGRLSFAVTAVGATTAVQTVQVSNTGNAALTFTHTGFSSGNSSDFIIDPTTTTCNFTVSLASGQSCKVGFTFKPTAVGLRAAYFALTDNTLIGVNTIYIAGIGATTATLTPASIAFAGTNVGSSSTAQTATLTNTGSGVLTISSLAISGADKSSYSFTDTCGSTLAAAATCTFSITFKPTVAGSLPATLLVGDNATTSSQAVSLSGTGKAPAITTPTKPKQPPVKILQ